MSDVKREEAVRTTDLAPPVKKSHSRVDVKIELDLLAAPGHARITSQDGKIAMLVPSGMLEKKFPRGERPKVAYFRARIGSGVNALEIEDRIQNPKVTW